VFQDTNCAILDYNHAAAVLHGFRFTTEGTMVLSDQFLEESGRRVGMIGIYITDKGLSGEKDIYRFNDPEPPIEGRDKAIQEYNTWRKRASEKRKELLEKIKPWMMSQGYDQNKIEAFERIVKFDKTDYKEINLQTDQHNADLKLWPDNSFVKEIGLYEIARVCYQLLTNARQKLELWTAQVGALKRIVVNKNPEIVSENNGPSTSGGQSGTQPLPSNAGENDADVAFDVTRTVDGNFIIKRFANVPGAMRHNKLYTPEELDAKIKKMSKGARVQYLVKEVSTSKKLSTLVADNAVEY
jgi:hypothetical protein